MQLETVIVYVVNLIDEHIARVLPHTQLRIHVEVRHVAEDYPQQNVLMPHEVYRHIFFQHPDNVVDVAIHQIPEYGVAHRNNLAVGQLSFPIRSICIFIRFLVFNPADDCVVIPDVENVEFYRCSPDFPHPENVIQQQDIRPQIAGGIFHVTFPERCNIPSEAML